MIELKAVPLQSVGDVSFGMAREEVRKHFGQFTEFKKNQFSKITTDAFDFCHVYYDEQNRCEAIEIFGAKVLINDQTVFPSSLNELKKIFPNAVEEYGSYVDSSISVGFYAPDDNVESILFGSNGYYL